MDEAPWLSEGEQRTWRAYLGAVATVRDELEAQLQRDAAMPHAYYELLVRLSEAPGRQLRMSALAGVSGFSRSRLSHAVTALETRGWVTRENCDTDRRGQNAVLTDVGLDVLRHAAPGHVAAVRQVLFDALTPLQIDELRSIGEAVVAHRDVGYDQPSGQPLDQR